MSNTAEQNLDNGEEAEIKSPFGEINFGKTAEELATEAAQYDHITEVSEGHSFIEAQKALTALVSGRTGIESRRAELKSGALNFGREVDSTAKALTAVLAPQEARIKNLVQAVKDKRQADKEALELAEAQRVGGIRERITSITNLMNHAVGSTSSEIQQLVSGLEQRSITETEYQEFIGDAEAAKSTTLRTLIGMQADAAEREHQAKVEADAQAEADAKRQAEDERLEKERKELADKVAEQEAKQAVIDAENQRLEDEQAEKQRIADAELQAGRDLLAKQQADFQAEQDRVAAEKKAEEDRIEAERVAKERELQEAADAERLAEEQAAAEVKRLAELELLKPDAALLKEYIDALWTVAQPNVTTAEGKESLSRIVESLIEAKEHANIIYEHSLSDYE